MPDIPCPAILSCPATNGTNLDWPIQNWTSEDPDAPFFIGRNDGYDNAPCLGCNWTTDSCLGLCRSTISQEDADLCAALNWIRCINDPDPPLPDPIPGPHPFPADDSSHGGDSGGSPSDPCLSHPETCTKPLYYNHAQTATIPCPDGTNFTYTLPANVIAASSQIEADRQAISVATNRALEKLICLGTPSGTEFDVCLGDTADCDSVILTVSGSGAPFSIATSGQLPDGIEFLADSNTSWVVCGQFTTAGNYVFTTKVTSSTGNTASRDFTISVLGITTGSLNPNTNIITLPSVKVDNAYSQQLSSSGGTGPYTYSSDLTLPPPAWVTLSAAGLISGTPDTVATNNFHVTVTDSLGQSCTKTVSINVTGPKITMPAAGTVCTPYVGDVVMTPVGSTVVSSSMPVGLTITAAGHITGTPLNTGNLTVTAQDPQGNQNTKTLTPFITLPGGQAASAAEDIVWTPTTIVDPQAVGVTFSTLVGDIIVISAHGGCVAGSVYSAEGIIDGDLRNCSSSGYNLTIQVDYNLPNGAACGANPHTLAYITIDYDGSSFSFGPLSPGTGTASHTYGIAGSSGAKHIRISGQGLGDDTCVFTVTLTPATPP